MYALAVLATSLLFFLRARAIFNHNTYFVCFLFCAWLSVLGTAVTVPIAVKGGNLGPTDYCLTVSATNYVGGTGVTTTIHDTLIFLNAWAFVTGQYLPQFSRAVLQDGQIYYLITVTSNLLALIIFYNTSIAETYSTMFTIPNLMVGNVMACHVFRNTKLGYERRVVTTSEMKTRETGSLVFMQTRSTQGGNAQAARANVALCGAKATRVIGTTLDPQDSDSQRSAVKEASNLV